VDGYQEGFKAGYRSAEQFYGLAARERLDRIAEATRACLVTLQGLLGQGEVP